MAVKRIVANVAAEQVDSALTFYQDVLGMQVVMDLGWIMTFAAHCSVPPQISVASEEGAPGRKCRTSLSRWITSMRFTSALVPQDFWLSTAR